MIRSPLSSESCTGEFSTDSNPFPGLNQLQPLQTSEERTAIEGLSGGHSLVTPITANTPDSKESNIDLANWLLLQQQQQTSCDAPGRRWSRFASYCKMLTCFVLFYMVLQFIPNMALQIASSSQRTPASSLTNIPSDGPSTIYQPAKRASPFFPEGSVVHDSYNGELKPAGRAVDEHGYVFVMYYADWSARSMEARNEFEKAAYIINGQVPFVAINCWYQSSECRSKYKFYSYPSFYVYASGMDMGFAFSGVEKAHYFVRFIRSLLNPITHIYNTSQLISFVANQESSLVGYFNLSKPGPTGKFQQFYYASLRSIEKDFIQPVRFGVVSDLRFASQYSMTDDRNLLLVRSVEDNLIYPPSGNFSSTAITKWVDKYQIKPLVNWLFPRGKKTFELYKALQSGPTVILLTPYDACFLYNKDVSLLREVVLDYYSCNATARGRTKLSTLISGSLHSRLSPVPPSLCLTCTLQQDERQKRRPRCCFSVAGPHSTCQVCITQRVCSGSCSHCHVTLPKPPRGVTLPKPPRGVSSPNHTQTCLCLPKDLKYSSDNNEVCCKSTLRRFRRLTDEYVARYNSCLPLHSVDESRWRNSDCISNMRLSVDSAICATNIAPNFLAIDSTVHSELVKRLGFGPYETGSNLALVNLTDESYYIMKGQFNKPNIVHFLEAFTTRSVAREQPLSSARRRRWSQFEAHSNRISVTDINSRQLQLLLANQNTNKKLRRDVVILFYSKWCFHCKAVNHLFLTAAKYLGKLTSIKLLRLDVSSNVLQWKHSVRRVPTITVFPYRAEAEQLPLMHHVEELITFILKHCSIEHLVELSTQSRLKADIVPVLRSRIAELARRVADYNNSNNDLHGSTLNYMLQQNRRDVKLLLLNSRKLYRNIHYSSLHYRTTFQPRWITFFTRFYNRHRATSHK